MTTRNAEASESEARHLSGCEAALLLGRRERNEAVKVLRAIAREGSPRVRRRVAECLTEIGGEGSIIGLTDLMRDPNADVRLKAVLGLGALRAHGVRSLLRTMLESETNTDVKVAIARALGMLSDLSGMSLICQLLNEGSERFRRSAAYALRDVIGQKFNPDKEGVDAAKRYLSVQGKRFLEGD